MSTNSKQRVIVVGGGVLGVSSALCLARQGADVTLVTEGAPAAGASGRSLSWLNSARRRSPHYHHLRMLGIDRYRTLHAQLPDAAWLRFDGGLTWDPAERNDIAAVFAHEKAQGYDARLLAPDEVARFTPGINASAIPEQGAIFNPGEGWVDLPSLVAHQLAEFARLGGVLKAGTERANVEVKGGRAVGVRVGGETLGADAVLLATGSNVPACAAELGVQIPDSTPISLLVRTRPVDVPLRAVVNSPRASVRPAPGGVLVVDSWWSEEEVSVNADGSYAVRPETVNGLLRETSAILEGTPALELDGYGVGPKPIPGDGEPVLGALEGVPGCYVAFSHSGATLALIAGELLADEIVSGTPHPQLASFRAGRFRQDSRTSH